MIGRITGILLVIVAGFAGGFGIILGLLTLPLIAVVFRGECSLFNWFRMLSIPAVMLLFYAFVWRLDPWEAKSAVLRWQNRTGPMIRERMVTSPFWRGVLWVGIICQILYVIMTVGKLKELLR